MRTLFASLVLAVVAMGLLISTPIAASAQSAQGGLRGTVKDAQSPIPGVTVTMVNEANGVTRETASNGVGEYSFPAVEPGSYTVRVALQGFKTFERKGVLINTQTFMDATPTLVLIDRAGKVALYHPGQMTREELEPQVAKLVAAANKP